MDTLKAKVRAAFEDYIRQSESDINDLQEEIKELKYKIARLEDVNQELRSDIYYLESKISDD